MASRRSRFYTDYIDPGTKSQTYGNIKYINYNLIIKDKDDKEHIKPVRLYPLTLYTRLTDITPGETKFYELFSKLTGSSIILNSLLLLNIDEINQSKIPPIFFDHIKNTMNYYISLYNSQYNYDLFNNIGAFIDKIINAARKIFLEGDINKSDFNSRIIDKAKYIDRNTGNLMLTPEKVKTIIKKLKDKNIYKRFGKLIIDELFLYMKFDPEPLKRPESPGKSEAATQRPLSGTKPLQPVPPIQPSPKPPPAPPPPQQKTKTPPENVATKTKRKIIGYRVNCKGGRKTTGSRKTRS